jgi:hypothetical protein
VTSAQVIDWRGPARLETRIRRARRLVAFTRESNPTLERRLRLLLRLVNERDTVRR